MFIFGSPVVDNGNNNNLNGSTSKANFLPYGIDFNVGPTKATGRFSNGKNIADLIGDHLKLPLIPSFANTQTQGDSILYGVNFGSRGSGILNETGAILISTCEGDRKLKYADHHGFLVITLIDTPRAYADLKSEELGQGEAIAQNIRSMFGLRVPVISIVTGEGGFGGALAICCCNKLFMLENPAFYVASANNKPKNGGSGFKGMFIFGSSVVDNGYNNNLNDSTSKANFLPYGLSNVNDPCCELTSNGSSCKVNGTTCDDRKRYAFFDLIHYTESASAILAAKLPLIPCFADTQTQRDAILNGVNFGSGGSGILDESGLVAGRVISLNEQITNFEAVTLPKLEIQLGCQRTEILPDYLFLLGAGNNDYLLNYFLLGQLTQTPQAFAAKLISAYSAQLKRLYNLGARNFLLLSVYPLGCSPVVSKGQGCLPGPNAVITIFYDQLISMVNQVKPQLPGSNFIVINSVKIITDIINNANSTGFSNVSGPCCEVSLNGLSCKENGNVCDDRSSYVYFDGQHNTESLSAVIANKAYTSRYQSEAYPINLHELAQTHL
uniref:acetyl-CoA carboxytransferase n=1 Tax=Chenopodium quinoa TaxID=63459 RepID=A0A803M570_CHEQI